VQPLLKIPGAAPPHPRFYLAANRLEWHYMELT
jgi:hypothetical protein